jgi:predicted kinase
MVDALSGVQKPAERLEFKGRLHGRISTALGFMHPKRPSLIIMHGPSGSGKSWLSERLVPLVAAVRLRSDLERKRLPHPGPDLYAPACNRETYARLLKCAESCLLGGVSVIVDAAFLNAEDRERFKSLAERCDASFVIVSCIADKAEMARRIAGRAQGNTDPSEATVAVLENQLQAFVPLSANELAHVIRVDTLQPNPERAAFATLQARAVNLGAPQVAWTQRRDRVLPQALPF